MSDQFDAEECLPNLNEGRIDGTVWSFQSCHMATRSMEEAERNAGLNADTPRQPSV